MRGLYVCLMFAVLTSATNGYDGSMMNGLQALDQWDKCKYSVFVLTRLVTHTFAPAFNNPSAPTRGLLNAIMSVGSIIALPITPYIADIFGRRAGIITGCILMIIGVILQSIGINI